jgi:hypothetical protein
VTGHERFKRIPLRILIVEDKPDDQVAYKEAIIDSCKNKYDVRITIAENREDAEKLLRQDLYPIISLDQNIPLKKGYEIKPEHGVSVGELALKTQPLLISFVLTAFPQWRPGTKLSSMGFRYFEKAKMKAVEYGQQFSLDIEEFLTDTAWRTSSENLPGLLSSFSSQVSSAVSPDSWKRFEAGIYLWEICIRLLYLSCTAVLDHLGEDISELLIPGRFENSTVLYSMELALNKQKGILPLKGLSEQSNEITRFFDTDFVEACKLIRTLRNEVKHKPINEKNEDLDKNISAFFRLLTGISFWRLHPLVTDIQVVSWGRRNVLRGQPLRGYLRNNKLEIWEFDSRVLVNPERLYMCIVDPEIAENALVVPLHPLIRLEKRGVKDTWWIAHRPDRNEYIEPLTGQTRVFDGNELSEWWEKKIRRR